MSLHQKIFEFYVNELRDYYYRRSNILIINNYLYPQ